MLFAIAQIHAGLIPAFFVFLLWTFPGAVAVYGLSLGVKRINDTLPDPVYALLSGINAAIVGIIALAAVQLARKAITDKLTRILVFLGGCSALCYNAIWYLPVLVLLGGLVAVAWDCVLQLWFRTWQLRRRRKTSDVPEATPEIEKTPSPQGEVLGHIHAEDSRHLSRSSLAPKSTSDVATLTHSVVDQTLRPSSNEIPPHAISVKLGIVIIIAFFVVFTALMAARGALHTIPTLVSLFNNMFLAGTIIFGGGPVVIPLLRDYVVEPGWVSPRDFLLGLAIIQAMPGPNFNFAVYLGAMTVARSTSPSIPTAIGAIIASLGIFTPGLWILIGFQSIWRPLRKRREVSCFLRGVNAVAVGFVFTAVYRLWEIGYLSAENSKGISLGQDPWWLVVASGSFSAVEWFSVPPPVAILMGGVAGLGWWGVGTS
jgi:chromate transport protein ChrA